MAASRPGQKVVMKRPVEIRIEEDPWDWGPEVGLKKYSGPHETRQIVCTAIISAELLRANWEVCLEVIYRDLERSLIQLAKDAPASHLDHHFGEHVEPLRKKDVQGT